ncbi:hypothetical protein QYF36_016386 [Acer negundo]|nr:hypothetical protein QYF36_016386 [Acer negundo]
MALPSHFTHHDEAGRQLVSVQQHWMILCCDCLNRLLCYSSRYSNVNWLWADKSLMASSGFQADVKALQKFLAARHLVSFQNSN